MILKAEYGNVLQFRMARVIEGQALYTMAAYYIDGLLIDTGPSHVAGEIGSAFNDITIDKIVNTHHHEDHIGNNVYFQQLGIPIYAHPLALPLIADPSIWSAQLRDYQKYVWGEPPASSAMALGDYINSKSHSFRVIHTPGHSPDHICLLEESQGWLFAGDIFLGEKVKMLRSDENIKDLLNSIEHLLNFNFETIFCASGAVLDNGHARMQRKLAYWRRLGEEIQVLSRLGMEDSQIRDQLLGPENIMAELTGGDFSRLNLVRSFLKVFVNGPEPD
jgi:glyoxylase-like metal-dependent hydrolase (beta-lactamase superfamily II)